MSAPEGGRPSRIYVVNLVDISSLPDTVGVVLQDPSNRTRLAKLDDLHQVQVSINIGHHEVHQGESFSTDAVDTSMNDGDTIILAFKTMAAPKRTHIVSVFSSLVGAHLELIEGPTWTAESGALNPISNRRRDSANISALLENSGQAAFTATGNMILNPTGLSGGTIIAPTVYVFGRQNIAAGTARDFAERVLTPDTQYAFRSTADGAANAGQIILVWYEHTDE